jgi:hypothetical protein
VGAAKIKWRPGGSSLIPRKFGPGVKESRSMPQSDVGGTESIKSVPLSDGPDICEALVIAAEVYV